MPGIAVMVVETRGPAFDSPPALAIARAQTSAWALLALQVVSLVSGAIAEALSTPQRRVDVDAGLSIGG